MPGEKTFDIKDMGAIKEEDEDAHESDEEVKGNDKEDGEDQPEDAAQNTLNKSDRSAVDDQIPGNQPWIKHTSIKVLSDPAVLSRNCRADSTSLANQT